MAASLPPDKVETYREDRFQTVCENVFPGVPDITLGARRQVPRTGPAVRFPNRPELLLGSLFWLALLLSTAALSETRSLPPPDCVVVLHGLARSASSMETLSQALEDQGYRTHNVDYPSTSASIQQLAGEVVPGALKQCDSDSRVHFVTHSMGGILVRQYLSDNSVTNLGRVVMLGVPNQGSELVDSLAEVPGFELVNGEAGFQLGTGENSVPRNLGAINFELGVIAGTQSYNPVYSAIIPGPDDGKVSVVATQVEGMTDHIELPVSHTFMMNDDTVIHQTLYFLNNGSFDR